MRLTNKIKPKNIDLNSIVVNRLLKFAMSLIFLGCGTLIAQVNFIQNQGQWNKKALYKADLTNGNLWLTDSGLLFNLWDADAARQMHDRTTNTFDLKQHAFYLHFKNGNFSDISALENGSGTIYNFYLGNIPSKWKTGIKGNRELLVRNLYPSVDLRIYSNGGNLKYNLECRNKAAIDQIVMQYIGVDAMQVFSNKIEVQTSVLDFTDAMPLIYAGEEEKKLNGRFELSDNEIRFKINTTGVSGTDRIVIDPILVFSTYTGSLADNFGCTGTYDDWGNGFAGGTVFSVGLPVTLGAFQTKFGGGVPENIGYGDGRDAAILKFNPNGTQLLYATYLGGNNNEQPHSMIADENGGLYIMGSTRSANFPVINGYDLSHNGDYDFFISHLSADGKSLISSTFIGGSGLDAVGANRENEKINNFPLLYNYADEFRGEIIIDRNSVYVSGVTYSINFPRSNNSGWYGGKEDACIFSLSRDLKTLNWSQLVGRDGYDAFYGLALGRNGDVYACGGTNSTSMLTSFPRFVNSYIGGLADGMVVRFNKATGQMLHAAHVGTNLYDQAYFVQTDNSGNPYLYGQTEGLFPRINSPYYQQGTGQFIVRLDSLLTNITLSTSFGAGGNKPNISPSAFLVDQCERIFISGWGGEVNSHLTDVFDFKPKSHRNTGNTYGMPITSDAYQKNTDGSDFYVAIFAKNMHSLLYATYFGGISNPNASAHEHVDGGTSRFDKKGIIYQSVCAGCGKNGLFPTTVGAYSRTNNSNNCNNALFKIDFENLNKVPVMRDTFIEVIATDAIGFSAIAVDPDPQDSVFVNYWVVRAAGSQAGSKPIILTNSGLGSASLSFAWNTDCNNYSKDTFELRVMLRDKGCPKSDTSFATIKILVKEPPKVIPPEAVCVSFDRNTGELKISWPSTPQPARFFNYFILNRINPNKSEIALDTIRYTAEGFYIDKSVIDAFNTDYCYYLEGFNTCGTGIKANQPYCTIRELNNPIEGVRLKFATVEEDRRVKIAWEMSNEPDFLEFEVYRFPRGESVGKNPYRITRDTVLLDSGFNVDQVSNCYMIVVADQCGHYSDTSNRGCNVVIKGSATGKPLYFFDLNWQQYLGWKQGTAQWELERKYGNYPWTNVTYTNGDLFAKDKNLDFDWGGYWYRVTATEFVKGQNHTPSKSESNWIYLIQPPEVYVPTGITSNGDNLNDVWGTVPVFVREYDMKVYNRWGQKVWESTDKKRQWDGTVNGVLAQDGVFAWHVNFRGWDDKTYRISGTVTIIH